MQYRVEEYGRTTHFLSLYNNKQGREVSVCQRNKSSDTMTNPLAKIPQVGSAVSQSYFSPLPFGNSMSLLGFSAVIL